MTFDKWIDAVNAGVRERLENRVRTEELSWDSAMWVGAGGSTAVASLANDERTATVLFDGGEKLSLAFRSDEAAPAIVSAAIAQHLI